METQGSAKASCRVCLAPSSRLAPSSSRHPTPRSATRRSSPYLRFSRPLPPALTTTPVRDLALSATPDLAASATDDAVLLFGATGRVGNLVLEKLLETGRDVVAAVRSADKLNGPSSKGHLKVVDGVDVLDPGTLSETLFEGVSQVMICLGPRTGGGFDPFAEPDEKAFAVDSRGVANITAAAEQYLTSFQNTDLRSIKLPAHSQWTSFGDTSQYGTSTGEIVPSEDGDSLRIEGTLTKTAQGRDAGCAFMSQWSPDVVFDCAGADGLHFSVKGDGRSYFMQLQIDGVPTTESECFMASFDTVKDTWTNVTLRFHEFRYAENLRGKPAPTLKSPLITRIGFMSSDTGPDALPARNSPEGDYAFEVNNVRCFRDARPQIVFLSSAAVERSARVGEDMEKRHEQIPIVRLNPGGTVNHKYEGENVLRRSTLPYSIVRPTQLINQEFEDKGVQPDLLRVGQGDTLVGRIRCVEVAEVLVRSLDRTETAFATFEVSRNPGLEAKKQEMTEEHYLQLFTQIQEDRHRARIGLPLFAEPIPVDSPIELGGRKWSPPQKEMVESVEAQRNALHAKRDKELLGQN